MSLTPPQLPEGYHWHITRQRNVHVTRRRLGMRRSVLIVTGYHDTHFGLLTLEHLHGRCVAAAAALENYLAVRHWAQTASLPSGWTLTVHPWRAELKGPRRGMSGSVPLSHCDALAEHPTIKVTPDNIEAELAELIGKLEDAAGARDEIEQFRQAASAS